jgi:methyl-accepting chemotaxis protein
MTKFHANHRRRLLINRDLQYALLFASLSYIFLFFAVIGLGLFIPLFIELGKASVSSPEVQQAASVLLYLHKNFWPAVLLSLLLIGLISIRASHKMAGPLYRMTLVLMSLKNGNLPRPITTRKGDQLVAEVELMNQMLERLRIQMREIQEARTDLYDAIVACGKVIGHGSTEEIIDRMNDIREKENQLADRIGYFKVE